MFSDRGRFARQAALRSIMNTKMSKGTLVKEHMIKMINLFNEMEILRVENNGETNIDMVLETLPASFSQFKLNYSMNRMI